MRALSLAMVALLALPGLAAADGPGQAAERERKDKEKRKAPPAKVFTNEDLKDAGKKGAVTFLGEPTAPEGEAPPVPSEPGSAAAAELGASPESGASAASGSSEAASETGTPQGEKGWGARAQALRSMVRIARAEVQRLEAKLEAIAHPQNQPQPVEGVQQDPYRQMTVDPKREELERDLAGARAALAQAEQDLTDFLEEARRAGIPPGWVEER